MKELSCQGDLIAGKSWSFWQVGKIVWGGAIWREGAKWFVMVSEMTA